MGGVWASQRGGALGASAVCSSLERTQPTLEEAVSLLLPFFKQTLVTVKSNIFPVTAYLWQQSWTWVTVCNCYKFLVCWAGAGSVSVSLQGEQFPTSFFGVFILRWERKEKLFQIGESDCKITETGIMCEWEGDRFRTLNCFWLIFGSQLVLLPAF